MQRILSKTWDLMLLTIMVTATWSVILGAALFTNWAVRQLAPWGW